MRQCACNYADNVAKLISLCAHCYCTKNEDLASPFQAFPRNQ